MSQGKKARAAKTKSNGGGTRKTAARKLTASYEGGRRPKGLGRGYPLWTSKEAFIKDVKAFYARPENKYAPYANFARFIGCSPTVLNAWMNRTGYRPFPKLVRS